MKFINKAKSDLKLKQQSEVCVIAVMCTYLLKELYQLLQKEQMPQQKKQMK